MVKAKNSNCNAAMNMLLGIYHTDSKERHYSMGKGESGVCDYKVGIILRWLPEYMHGFLYQNENQGLSSQELLYLLTFWAYSYSCISIISLEESAS